MPTGLTDPGEDIVKAVIREVKEETGLDCTFHHVLCFREAHPMKAKKTYLSTHSDIFFVCLVQINDTGNHDEDGNIIFNPQEAEILDIQWMNVRDYVEQGVWLDSPLYNEMNDVILRASYDGMDGDEENDVNSSGFGAKTLPIGWRPGSNTIYSSKL